MVDHGYEKKGVGWGRTAVLTLNNVEPQMDGLFL